MKTFFVIARLPGEAVTFFVNGKEVGYANHDEHGWAGMLACEELFIATAAAVGAAVTEK